MLGQMQKPSDLALIEDRNKYISLQEKIHGKLSDPKKLIEERVKLWEGIYDPAIKDLGKAKERAGAYKKKQLDIAEQHMDKREVQVNDRASKKLADIAARGVKAKERGENNAMQNLFLNFLLPASLEGGRNPAGFMAGALKGAQDNMENFVDRFTDLKDKYATGQEKRDREKTGVEDKRMSDIFEIEDIFNTRQQQLDSDHFKLTEELEKEISNKGTSKRAAVLKEKLKEIEYMQQGASAANEIITAKKAQITDVNDMVRENAATYTAILDLPIFDPSNAAGSKNQKDFNNKIESLRKDTAMDMGFTIGKDSSGNDILMVGNEQVLDRGMLQEFQAKFEADKRKFLQDMVRLGTSYPSQALAMLRVSQGSGGSTRIKFNKQGQQVP